MTDVREVTRTERVKSLVEYRIRHGALSGRPRELVDALPIRHRHGADY